MKFEPKKNNFSTFASFTKLDLSTINMQQGDRGTMKKYFNLYLK